MRNPKVLLLATDDIETAILRLILSNHVALRKVGDLLELQRDLSDHDFDAVFCGWSFPGGTWSDALQQVQQRCLDLPMIIFSRTGGEREWIEVLEAGGFDLLVPPYQRIAVLSVLEHAIASHDARRSRKLNRTRYDNSSDTARTNAAVAGTASP